MNHELIDGNTVNINDFDRLGGSGTSVVEFDAKTNGLSLDVHILTYLIHQTGILGQRTWLVNGSGSRGGQRASTGDSKSEFVGHLHNHGLYTTEHCVSN